MKITDPEVIKNGEKDLIESVQEDLDLESVRKILKERMAVAALASKGGQIVVHDNKIAFRLDFEVNLSGSLLFDRDGNFIDEDPSSPSETEPDQTASNDLDPDLDLNLENDPQEDSFDFPDLEEIEDSPLEDLGETQDSLDNPVEDDTDQDPMEELSIDLPDYDLDDEDLEDEDLDMGTDQALDPELDLGDLEGEEDLLVTPVDELDTELEEPMDEADGAPQDLDDDINDIIKESREFWEQKKDS
jgi:hypothetical protein